MPAAQRDDFFRDLDNRLRVDSRLREDALLLGASGTGWGDPGLFARLANLEERVQIPEPKRLRK